MGTELRARDEVQGIQGRGWRVVSVWSVKFGRESVSHIVGDFNDVESSLVKRPYGSVDSISICRPFLFHIGLTWA